MLCRQVRDRASECPNTRKSTAFSFGKRAFGTFALVCAMFDDMCYGATVKEIDGDQDANVIEDFVAISVKSLERFVIFHGRATKTLSGFMSVQPIAVLNQECGTVCHFSWKSHENIFWIHECSTNSGSQSRVERFVILIEQPRKHVLDS